MKRPEDIIGWDAVGLLTKAGYSIQPADLDYLARTEDAWKELTREHLEKIAALRAMLRFLREHGGECLADHPNWLAKIDALLGVPTPSADDDAAA